MVNMDMLHFKAEK